MRRLFQFFEVLIIEMLQMAALTLCIGTILFAIAIFLSMFFDMDILYSIALWATGIIFVFLEIVAVLGTIRAYTSNTEGDLIDGINEYAEESKERRQHENEIMTNVALRDYHRSKGRYWF